MEKVQFLCRIVDVFQCFLSISNRQLPQFGAKRLRTTARRRAFCAVYRGIFVERNSSPITWKLPILCPNWCMQTTNNPFVSRVKELQEVQRSAKVSVSGLVQFVPALAYLAGTKFTKPRTNTLADLCIFVLKTLHG